MHRKSLLIGAMSLALGLQASWLSAQEFDMDAAIEAARPHVDLADNGLFIEAPLVSGFVTLNVRVADESGQLVLNTRSRGESVQLLASGLPDGRYVYEAVSVFTFIPSPGSEAEQQGENEAASRSYGNFRVSNGEVIVKTPVLEESGVLDSARNAMLAVADKILSLLVDDAVAQDVAASSAAPYVQWDDTDAPTVIDYRIEVSNVADDNDASWILQDWVGAPSASLDVITIESNGGTLNGNSWFVQQDGDQVWGNGSMALDRSTQELSIGSSTLFPSDFNIYNTVPDIRMTDETDDSSVDIQLNDGVLDIFGQPSGDGFRSIFSMQISAPADSLVIDSGGTVTAGVSLQSPFIAAFENSDSGSLAGWANNEGNLLGLFDDRQLCFAELFGDPGCKMIWHNDMGANAFVIEAGGNVGFGTEDPTQAVDVQRSAAAARFQLTSFTDTGSEAPQYIQRRARGTSAAPAALLTNDNLGLFSFRGMTPGGFGGSRATITVQAAGNFTNASTPTRMIFATTPVGETSPQQVMVINPNGTVSINGQQLNVPDYVFEEDYALMPLDELRSFITTNKHLPGVAPAAEVNANGLDIAGSQLSVLEKVEELTLYTLQQHEQIKSLQQENASLRVRQAELQAQVDRVDRLEALVGLLMADRAGEPVLTASH